MILHGHFNNRKIKKSHKGNFRIHTNNIAIQLNHIHITTAMFLADFVQEKFKQQAVVVTVDIDCRLYDPRQRLWLRGHLRQLKRQFRGRSSQVWDGLCLHPGPGFVLRCGRSLQRISDQE